MDACLLRFCVFPQSPLRDLGRGRREASWTPWARDQETSLCSISHSLCSPGPITWETWQGSVEEVNATASSECSSVVGNFERQPGWEEQDLIDRVWSWSGLFYISFLNNHSSPCPHGSLALSPLPLKNNLKTFCTTMIEHKAFLLFIPREIIKHEKYSISWFKMTTPTRKTKQYILSRAFQIIILIVNAFSVKLFSHWLI